MRPIDANALTERVARFLSNGAEMTSSQIAAKLDKTAKEVSVALAALRLKRRVEECGVVMSRRGGFPSPIWRARAPELSRNA